MPEQERVERLLDIVVGATVAFLPFVAIRLLDQGNFSITVILLAVTVTALIIINEWWWLVGTLREQGVSRGVFLFFGLVVAYILGLVGLPLALVTVTDHRDTFAFFAGILTALSLVDGSLYFIAAVNSQGRQRRSCIFNVGWDAFLAFGYGVIYIVYVRPDLDFLVTSRRPDGVLYR